MFVPDPVISLSLSPVGQESPNFSRALNRFKKEDPTFRVHVDSESKEVRAMNVSYRTVTDIFCDRLLSLGWVNYILRFTLNACVVSTTSSAQLASPVSLSAKPPPNV
jgi:hypothetical protein